MKTAGAPGSESAFIPRGGKGQRRDADRLQIPDAARRCIHINPRLHAENLQIALMRFDSPGLSPMQNPFRSPPSALRSQKIGFDPVGSTAKPSAIKTAKITLIALIGFAPLEFHQAPIPGFPFDRLRALSKRSASKRLVADMETAEPLRFRQITLIALIGWDAASTMFLFATFTRRRPIPSAILVAKPNEITLIHLDSL